MRLFAVLGMMWAHKGKILTLFFLFFLLTPLWHGILAPADSIGARISNTVNGFGASIAKPDSDIKEQITLLKEGRDTPTPEYALNYLILIAALVEFVVLIYALLYFQSAVFLSNTSAMFSLGNIFLLVVIYSLCLNAYSGMPPFAGFWDGENALLWNIGILVDPVTPVYQTYAYLQTSVPIISLII